MHYMLKVLEAAEVFEQALKDGTGYLDALGSYSWEGKEGDRCPLWSTPVMHQLFDGLHLCMHAHEVMLRATVPDHRVRPRYWAEVGQCR